MNAARRSHRKRDWPRGLYEPRAGYFIWRSLAGTTFAIGRVSLGEARAEAIAANAHESGNKATLVERLTGAVHTIADIMDKMPPQKAANSIRSVRSLDNSIRAELGNVECRSLTVAKCAEFIEAIADTGKSRSAEAHRSRLVRICKRGMALGWLTSNPAEVTDTPKVAVKRGRLTLDAFHAIYAQAPKVSGWLQRTMMIGLVLGADLMTIAGLQRSNVGPDALTYRRQKTGRWIVVPLQLRMAAVNTSLEELLVHHRSPVLSPYIVHHPHTQGGAKAGDPVHPNTISKAFTAARKLAGIPDEAAPTFHELRSLCKRTYDAQGGVDTKALLGHAGERVSDLYADARGVEPVRVRLNVQVNEK